MRLVLFSFIFSASLAFGHQPSVSSSKKELKWNYGTIPIRIYNNSSSLSNASTVIEQSMAQWNSVSGVKLQKSSSGSNVIRFESDFSIYGSAVVGVTEVNYNSSGTINAASIILNEQDYDFSNVPGLSLFNQVYLGDVVTHELGHFLGLAHSEVLRSSMFFSNFPGQFSIAEDDIAGIRSKYSSGYGTISGQVMGGNQVGVLGAHVQAVSIQTGESISAISDEDGSFEIRGLSLNDTYYLYTSPLKNLDALPGYYANVQTEFCPASYVGDFFSACGRENDGLPQPITLTSADKSVDVGAVSISCVQRTNEDYNFQKLQATFSPLTIWSSNEGRESKSFAGFFRNSQLSTTSFSTADKFVLDLTGYAAPKTLNIKLISQSFGNPIEYAMTVKHNGSSIAGSPFYRTVLSDSTFNLDLNASRALSTIAAQNIFEIEIQARKLTTTETLYSIPSYLQFASDQHYPYLLSMGLWESGTPLLDTGVNLSDNLSCLDAPFTFAMSHAEIPEGDGESTRSSTAEAATAAASCGTIDPPQGPGPGSFMALLSSAFCFVLLLSKLLKRTKNFLS